MKTTYNKRETAQRERAKNLAIYNEVAAIARDVFNYLDIEAGTYSAAQVATAINKEVATWNDSKEDYLSEVVKIEIDGFSCRFPRGLAFDILNNMATAYNITSSARVTFERSTEANERRAADIQTAAERQAQAEAQAQAAAEAAARLAEEKRARRRENDRRRRAAKKAQAQAERAQAQAEAQAAEAARRAAMTPADIEREIDRQRRRAESSARRGRYIYEHSTKFSCGSDIELINKIIVVTIEANGQKIFKCWAVGACDSFYYICGSLTENNYIKDSNRSYKKENRAAVANWIYLTRQAAQKNGWKISIYSETPAPAAGYFVPAISTAAEDTIKRAQAAAAPAADIETPAAVPSIESTTANDDTAAPAADIETRETPANDGAPRRRAGKSINDMEAQRERIKAAALDIVLTREGHSDGRTKEDRRQRPRLELVNLIYNVYYRRALHYFARTNKKQDRAALVPAEIYAPAVPTMTATANDITINFAPYMEPGGWEPSANTFAELCEGLKHSDTRELCRAEIERRAIEAAHKFTAELGTIDRSATANELTAVFLSGVDRWAAETAPRFASVDDFIKDMVPTSAAANDDTPAPAADIESTTANDDTAAPAADIEAREEPAAVPSIDTAAPAAEIETREEPAAAISLAANFARRAHRWFQIAAAVLVVFIISSAPILTDPATPAPAADIETREEPAALLNLTAANDDTAAPAADIETMEEPPALLSLTAANDDTAAPAAEPDSEAPAAPAADIETREEPAALLSLTPANDDTAAPAAEPDSEAPAAPAADIETREEPAALPSIDTAAPAATLYEAGEITETSDPAAVPSADAAANDDTANDAPAIANDDTANDDTAAPAESDTDESDSQSDTAPTSAATGATAAPSTTAPASVVIIGPAPAWSLIL